MTTTKKIDRRRTYKIVIDTETCPVDKDFEGVEPTNMWVYDIGWQVVDKHGNVYERASYINKDIFYGERDLMKSAYYANKIPKYEEEIASGQRVVDDFYTIRKTLMDMMKEYEIKEVYAHNMRFDYGTLNTTERWLTKSKYRYFFPYGTEICDTLKMARDVLGKMPTYIRFCEENGFTTSTGKPRFTAEIIYRYITKDVNFVESHTALEDVEIETEILAYCYRQHKKMRRKLWEK